MIEIMTIILRTVFLYFLILVAFRVMGKREIGELSILDLVIFIMLAELAVLSIEDTNIPLWSTILPMVVLVIIQLGLAYISLKSQKIREVLDGKPSIIINNGKIDEEEMSKQRYNFDDLMIQLREKEVKSVADVEFAILEPSGKLSVFEKDNEQGSKDGTPPLPFIMDGVIQQRNLAVNSRTTAWLKEQLTKRGYQDIENISYCTVDDNGELYVDINENGKK